MVEVWVAMLAESFSMVAFSEATSFLPGLRGDCGPGPSHKCTSPVNSSPVKWSQFFVIFQNQFWKWQTYENFDVDCEPLRKLRNRPQHKSQMFEQVKLRRNGNHTFYLLTRWKTRTWTCETVLFPRVSMGFSEDIFKMSTLPKCRGATKFLLTLSPSFTFSLPNVCTFTKQGGGGRGNNPRTKRPSAQTAHVQFFCMEL